jgi:hypothetical protein
MSGGGPACQRKITKLATRQGQGPLMDEWALEVSHHRVENNVVGRRGSSGVLSKTRAMKGMWAWERGDNERARQGVVRGIDVGIESASANTPTILRFSRSTALQVHCSRICLKILPLVLVGRGGQGLRRFGRGKLRDSESKITCSC